MGDAAPAGDDGPAGDPPAEPARRRRGRAPEGPGPRPGLPRPARALAQRPVPRPGGRPVRLRRRDRLPVRHPGPGVRRGRSAVGPARRHPEPLGRRAVPRFRAFWSRDAEGLVTPAAEKAAFERTVDFIIARLDADPTLHVYHYAAYEKTALARLAQRHATREEEVDRLLRGRVLVDLYRVVRQGIRASVESYSIKRLEPLYGLTREVALKDAGSSIVEFETWLGRGATAEGLVGDAILREIEGYNRDDVVSTWRLRDWLELRRGDLAARLGMEIPRPPAQPEAAEPAEPEGRAAEVAEVVAALTRDLDGVDLDAPDDDRRATGDVAPGPAAGLAPPGEQGVLVALLRALRHDRRRPRRRARADRDGRAGRRPRPGQPERRPPPAVPVPAPGPRREGGPPGRRPADREVGRHRHRRRRPRRHRHDLPDGDGAGARDATRRSSRTTSCRTTVIEDSLLRIGRWVARDGLASAGCADPYRAGRELLLRRPPRIAGAGPRRAAPRRRRDLAGGRRPARPGPRRGHARDPGSAGNRQDLHRRPHDPGPRRRGEDRGGHGQQPQGDRQRARRRRAGRARDGRDDRDRRARSPSARSRRTTRSRRAPSPSPSATRSDIAGALAGGTLHVVGGTAWLWSAEVLAGSVDVLLVDEAGQFSLANTVAVSPAGRSLVLLGDPQQLDQPLKGSHPPGAERSALAHLLAGAPGEPSHATMPPERGLFIERTWRLHPSICSYTSELFYASELHPIEGLGAPGDRPGREAASAGCPSSTRATPRTRSRRPTRSSEVVRDLLDGGRHVDEPCTGRGAASARGHRGRGALQRPRRPDRRGPRGRRLRRARGSARSTSSRARRRPLSIYAMGSSSPEDAPRGMEFLYSLNRLNVATSRARCVALVVASPALVGVSCATPRQMQLANALCRLVEVASPVSRPG